MGMVFEDEEIAPVQPVLNTGENTPSKKTPPGVVQAPIGPVGPNDSMKDIHEKLRAATKNDRDAIYASAREQDLLKKMEPASVLREKFGSNSVPIKAGEERVNIMARRVRAISSDGDSIEIDMEEFKEKNRKAYLQSIGKLPPDENSAAQTKRRSKQMLSFDE